MFSSLNFLLLGNFFSTYVCFFVEVEMPINYGFEIKETDVPKWVIGIYIIINIILGMIIKNDFIISSIF